MWLWRTKETATIYILNSNRKVNGCDALACEELGPYTPLHRILQIFYRQPLCQTDWAIIWRITVESRLHIKEASIFNDCNATSIQMMATLEGWNPKAWESVQGLHLSIMDVVVSFRLGASTEWANREVANGSKKSCREALWREKQCSKRTLAWTCFSAMSSRSNFWRRGKVLMMGGRLWLPSPFCMPFDVDDETVFRV